jgi:hypothetical protein
MKRFLLVFALLTAPAAAVPQRPPAAYLSVLVDLSQTWHNRGSLPRNRRLLVAVGNAIVSGQAGLPKPIQVTYRVIGKGSLVKDAFFTTSYAPSLLASTTAATAASIAKFRDRIAGPAGWAPGPSPTVYDPVPLLILRQPPEAQTEIMGAIIAARRADALADRDTVRMMIVLSDFVEDSTGLWQLKDSLKGYRIWLIGRVLPEDAGQSEALSSRMRNLEIQLEKRGAVVQTLEESALLASPAAFAARIDEAGRK